MPSPAGASPVDAPERSSNRRCLRHVLATYERNHPHRAHVEHFIQHAFAVKHGANIRSFMPTLLALEGADQRVCGVAGFRNAGAEALFLERYLSEPIELALAHRLDTPVSRTQIVEVGNLASLSCRAAFHLICMLPRVLIDRGNRWVVFTATSAVRGILEQFKAPVIELAGAHRDKVEHLGDDWGRYYENDPRVMAGYLPDGLMFDFVRSRN